MATPGVGGYTGAAMPIYQYDCAGCERRVDIFFRSAGSAAAPACPQCGGTALTRVMSSFARTRSSSERIASIDFDREMGRLGSGDEGDFARWAKRLGKQYDEELGSNFGELAERAEGGADPVERVDPGFKLRYELEKKRGARKGGTRGDGAG